MLISIGEWFPFRITMDAHTSRAKLKVRLIEPLILKLSWESLLYNLLVLMLSRNSNG